MRREDTRRSIGIRWRKNNAERLVARGEAKQIPRGARDDNLTANSNSTREIGMAKKAGARDAEVILRLYDLRREAELRKARQWWLMEFSPRTADDFVKVAWALGTQENNWLRQVPSYWGMAASFVLQGAVSEELFLRPAFSGEMFVMYAKVHPFLAELREKLEDPEVFLDVEKVVMSTKWGRERLKFIMKRIEMMREKTAKKSSGE
jgi:hypothetical protein